LSTIQYIKNFLSIGKLLLAGMALCSSLSVSAQDSAVVKRPGLIDAEQDRIDKLDGKLDHFINAGDTAISQQANFIYFEIVDYMQRILDKKVFDKLDRNNFNEQLFYHLRRVNRSNFYRMDETDKLLVHILGCMNAVLQGNLESFYYTNPQVSIRAVGFFKNEEATPKFLNHIASQYPVQVLENHFLYDDKPYATEIISKAAVSAPITAKKYFLQDHPIMQILKHSTDPDVVTLLSIEKRFGKSTNAYTLLDPIAKGKLSLDSAHDIGKDQYRYLQQLLETRINPHPLAEHSLEADLETYSLKYVRIINDLHNEADNIRFANTDSLTTKELYTLMVYSEEEIFTSTFNGCFKRLLAKLDSANGYEFLTTVGFNRFRTFIKMCASYGKLQVFLNTMTPEQRQQLMVDFASNLEASPNSASQAVEVADAFGSITDTIILDLLKSTIKKEFERVKIAKHKQGEVLYGLLTNLFVGDAMFKNNWFASIAAKYQLPPIDKVNFESLFRRNRHNIWQMYFYDDEDGDASFKTFLAEFRDPNWIIQEHKHYVKIMSREGAFVSIYANRPKSEYIGQPMIEKLLDSLQQEPDIMIHRGHSYYAYKTIEKIHNNTAIFILGSCGGYNSLSSIFERSPNVSVISSKQIGTMFVNNPLVKLLAEDVRNFRDINWYTVWSALEGKVKNNKQAYERFQDYIPPHKNLGALFIRAYNKLNEE
jgi:hypothetical protein